MKDYLYLPKKISLLRKKASKFHVFDVVIILFLLNIVAFTLIIQYVQKINSYALPNIDKNYLPIKSVSLPQDLQSINASASAYVVYDVKERRVIAGKNQSLRFSPASTAKVMSAILALEHYDINQVLVVPYNIYSVVGSKMNLVAGEQITVRNLLYGMMLPSGNDAAYTIASYFPGGFEGFVKAMNVKAAALQLNNTHFEDASGYQDGNYTTGEELARLGAYAMQNPEFAAIVKTRSIQVANANNTHPYYLQNLNELLYYPNVVGIKTGFTNEAGGVLLTAIKKDEKLFIVSVLKSEDRFSDTRDLMDFIQEKVDFAQPTRH